MLKEITLLCELITTARRKKEIDYFSQLPLIEATVAVVIQEFALFLEKGPEEIAKRVSLPCPDKEAGIVRL